MSLRCRVAYAGRLSWTRSARWRRSTSTSPRSPQRSARHDVSSGTADTSVAAVWCMRHRTADHTEVSSLTGTSHWPAQDGEQQAMPSNLRKSRLPQLSLVPVITREVDVDPGGRYEGLPHFSHFGDQIKFVGGVNRPKLIQARMLLCLSQELAIWLPDDASITKVSCVEELQHTQPALEKQTLSARGGRFSTATVGGIGSL